MGVRRHFPPHPAAAGEARRFVRSLAPDAADGDVELAATELASNAIRHARTSFAVRVCENGDVLRLEVSDGLTPTAGLESARDRVSGLRIVDAITDRWGVEPTADGKTIWAEFRLQGPTPE